MADRIKRNGRNVSCLVCGKRERDHEPTCARCEPQLVDDLDLDADAINALLEAPE